jgi:hypothetical protein
MRLKVLTRLLAISMATLAVPAMAADPIGYLDVTSWEGLGRSVHIQGWSIDPDTAASIDVHVYANGTFQTAATANSYRPDVGAAFPGYGNFHGYDLYLRPEVEGDIQICVYGINVGPGTVNSQLGCMTVAARHKTVAVCENSSGIDAGVALFHGDDVSISASGTIWAGVWFTGSNDPNGWYGRSAGSTFPKPGAAPYSLLASFAGSPGSWFFEGTGSNFELYADYQTYTMFFRTNDDKPGNGSGCFSLRIDASY